MAHLVWIHPLIPLLEFRKHHHGTEQLWLFALGHQGETASSSPTFLWSKRTTTRRKTPLNCHSCLVVQPFILIPVDTCYFFDAKYKETSDGSLIREYKFKAVFTERSASARLPVRLLPDSGRKTRTSPARSTRVWSGEMYSRIWAQVSWNYQKIISFLINGHHPIKKSHEKKVLGHKTYELFQAPLGSETNQTSKRFLLFLYKPPAQVH